MASYRTTSVFVPGGLPSLTYVPREARKLESRVASASDNLCKLVTITGPTKSGKTVLVSTVFPRDQATWVNGGVVRDEDDLWTHVLDQLSGHTEIEVSNGRTTAIEGSVEAGGEAKLPLVGGVQATAGGSLGKSRTRGAKTSLSLSPRVAATRQLARARIPLVIDDFHYLDRDLQGHVIRALKNLIFEGLPVILIAIPHRRYDAVKVEREITGRLETIDIPSWDVDELMQISSEGFPLLNMNVTTPIAEQLASEAYGSPHLMQEFCRHVALKNGVEQTSPVPIHVPPLQDALFRDVAEGTGRVIFDRLAQGPRQRTDRIPRLLKNGRTADIYEVVLYALARLAPGLQTIEYEQLRAAIRDVLSESIPRAHEVTRVLEKMAEIAAEDESSTPVIDWEKKDRRLHVTDPFFAFFLKWGLAAA